MRQARAPWLSNVVTKSLVLLRFDFANLLSANQDAAFKSGLLDVEPWFPWFLYVPRIGAFLIVGIIKTSIRNTKERITECQNSHSGTISKTFLLGCSPAPNAFLLQIFTCCHSLVLAFKAAKAGAIEFLSIFHKSHCERLCTLN